MSAPITPMLSVYNGKRCVGFIIARGKAGFEAFSAEERSIGTFKTQRAAAAALEQPS